jgi:Ca2+-binding RTX toxin-like protein
MATRAQLILALNSISYYVSNDPGLAANISRSDIVGGANAAKLMNEVLADAIIKTGAFNDGFITPMELMRISDAIRADKVAYAKFLTGHGDDEFNLETGFHLVQGDGGSLEFQGRNFVDTIADAIYHAGFTYSNGRFVNEDGNQNELVDDITGWLNYFLTGRNVVFGTGGADELYSGRYSAAFAAARNETFLAGTGNDNIWADDGNDNVYAGAGNDKSGGGTGNDRIYGEAGDDGLWGDDGDDYVSGGLGNDQIGGGTGNDLLYGDAGVDEIGGGTGNDFMEGGENNDSLWGEEGGDIIRGGNGNDRIGGGSGNDFLYGDAGNDTVYGDSGNDTLWGFAGDDILGGTDGNDVLNGGDGVDQLYGGDGADRMNGDAGNDEMYGDAGADWLNGRSGNDSIWGGDAVDVLFGDIGNDKLSGGNDRDIYFGGKGADVLADWEDWNAADIFVFAMGDSGVTSATRDVVEGFDSGTDKIDLRSIAGLKFRPDDVTFAGGGIKSAYFNGTILFVDGTGDGVTDMTIEFKWVSDLATGDFLLA